MSLPYEFTSEELVLKGRATKLGIETIQTWLRKSSQSFVPKILPDELITIFLISCENNIDLTKSTIIAHYKLKKESPELHDNRNYEGDDAQLFFDTWIMATFPIRTKRNYAIHYFQLEDSDYRKMHVPTFFKLSLMLVDITQKKDPPDGFVAIIDMGVSGLGHLTKLKFEPLMKYLSFVQEGLPMQLRAIHIMNSNFLISKVFHLVRSCIRNDILNKIYFHSPNKLEKLYEHIPKKCLPREYGGDLPSLKELHETTKKEFKGRQEFWDLEQQIRSECK